MTAKIPKNVNYLFVAAVCCRTRWNLLVDCLFVCPLFCVLLNVKIMKYDKVEIDNASLCEVVATAR